MKYLIPFIYGVLAVLFFFLTFSKNKKKEKKEKEIYKPYEGKIRKIISPLVKVSGVLFGISMIGFFVASIFMLFKGEVNTEISILLYKIFAFFLLVPVGIVVFGWIFMQFHRKKK